jgi:calcineurin-like phosphoesterase family protein
MKYFFSSDFHFNHVNILTYSKRPFKNVEEMNETIITNWNSRVSPNDVGFFLGDFVFGGESEVARFLSRLNGTINIIFGNHDKSLRNFAKHVVLNKVNYLGDYAEVTINGQFIVLSHYAFRVWNRSHYGSYNLYAHSHGSLPDDPNARAIDVGVDCHNFYPISFEQVAAIMEKKNWKPIDHHGERLQDGGVGLSKDDYAKAERKRDYEILKKEFEP